MRQERSIMKASRPASWNFQIITPLRCISGANIFCIILGFKVQFNGKYTPLSGYWMHYTSNYVDGKREINWANSQWCPYPYAAHDCSVLSLSSPGRVQCENYSWNYFYDRPLCRGRAELNMASRQQLLHCSTPLTPPLLHLARSYVALTCFVLTQQLFTVNILDTRHRWLEPILIFTRA